MFIPDQTKTNFAELLGDEKTLRKIKRTQGATSNKPSIFEGGIGDVDIGDGDSFSSAGHHSHEGSRRDAQRNAAKAISGLGKTQKRSYRQMLVGAIFLIALSGGLVSTIWTIVEYLTGASLFPFVNVNLDESKMDEIFNSGQPYVVYCQIGNSKSLPKLLVDAGNMLPRGYNTAMMDCNFPVKAWDGKSVYSKFDLNDRDVPAFVVANGEKPKQFNRNSFYNVEYFVEFVKVQSIPKFQEIESQVHFKVACTDKDICLVIGHKGKLSAGTKEAIENANSYFRKSKIATIDTSKYAINLDEVLTKSLEAQMSQGKTGKEFLSGLCYSKRSYEQSKPITGFVRRMTDSEIYQFIKDCVASNGMENLTVPPTLEVKKRSTKKSKKTEESKKEPKKRNTKPRVHKASDNNEKRSQYTDDGQVEKASDNGHKDERSQYADDGMEIDDIDE
jgi:hypothetical protein